MTILLVEQNAKLALQAAHRGYVMDSGAITMTGNAQDMLHDPTRAGGLSRRVGNKTNGPEPLARSGPFSFLGGEATR